MGKRKKFNKNGKRIPKQSREVLIGYQHKKLPKEFDLKDLYDNDNINQLDAPKEPIEDPRPLREIYPDATFIRNWDELREYPNESETHIMEIEKYNGHLHCKKEKPYDSSKSYDEQIPYLDHYLSTHTFYGDPKGSSRRIKNYRTSTHLLQRCGFNVILRGDYGDEDQYEEKIK